MINRLMQGSCCARADLFKLLAISFSCLKRDLSYFNSMAEACSNSTSLFFFNTLLLQDSFFLGIFFPLFAFLRLALYAGESCLADAIL